MNLEVNALTPEKIKQLQNDAWLDVDVDENTLASLFDTVPPELSEKPHLWYTYLLSQPDYFYTLCKEILNVDLLPFQCVVLMVLWNHKFPLLCMNRGAGKSFLLGIYAILRSLLIPGRKIIVCGSAFRQSKIIFEYIVKIWNNAPILRNIMGDKSGPRYQPDRWLFNFRDSTVSAVPIGTGDSIRGLRANDILSDEFSCLSRDTLIQTDQGLIEIGDYMQTNAYQLLNMNNQLETPTKIIKTPLTDVYKITTENGYSFKCSSIHQVYTDKGWKLAKDLIPKKDILPLDQNKYFPERYINNDGFILNEKIGYLLGFLVAEGTNTNRNLISMSNTVKCVLDKIKNMFPEYTWSTDFKPARIDNRGWACKDCWVLRTSNTEFRTNLLKFGLDYVVSYDKSIPQKILQSPRSVIVEFLKGIFYGDGTYFEYMSRDKKYIGGAYYSSSKKLIDQLQILLLKFGIKSSQILRNSNISKEDNYMLSMRGINAKRLFDLLEVENWAGLIEDANYTDRKPSIRKNGERWIVSTSKNNKNIHLGTFDTQEECVTHFCKFWENEPEAVRVRSVELLPEKDHLYDFYMPETHSFRGGGFIQHNSLNKEIFETVISGFAAVRSEPAENVKYIAKKRMNKMLKIIDDMDDIVHDSNIIDNQIVISGTSYYSFSHYYDYWQRWKSIVLSKGDKKKLADILNDTDIPRGFNWKDYAVIRLPYDLLPEGFMDDAQLARGKATMDTGRWGNEFCSIFSKDSNGYFRRTLIESCVVNKPINLSNDRVVYPFTASLYGDKEKKYVIGVDPASERDNLAISVVEINGDYRKIVYSWTMNRKKHIKLVQEKLVRENDFYGFCARKIRTLMDRFPCSEIGIDTQGGGVALMEALHDNDKLGPTEVPIWPKIDPDKPRMSDGEKGLHIIEPINFASADWVQYANTNLRKDFEDKMLLFPQFDSAILSVAEAEDDINKLSLDTLEDCVMDIEELKDELSSIVMTATPSGRERWDTPDKITDGKKGNMRKDRYSALLIANTIARKMYRDITPEYKGFVSGGFSSQSNKIPEGQMFLGQAWLVDKYTGLYD